MSISMVIGQPSITKDSIKPPKSTVSKQSLNNTDIKEIFRYAPDNSQNKYQKDS